MCARIAALVALFFVAAVPPTRALAPPKSPLSMPPASGAPIAPPDLQVHIHSNIPSALGVDYRNDIAPVIAHAGCATYRCHGGANGKGGLKLSLFGAYPKADYEALAHAAAGRRINTIEPPKSLLLLKTAATLSHGGGQRFKASSPGYSRLLTWIQQGAPWEAPGRPHITTLQISPAEVVLAKASSHAVKVIGLFSDGSRKDVTDLAVFRSSAPSVATISATGLVTAKCPGQSALIAIYLRRPAIARALVPQTLPFPFPTTRANNQIDTLNFAHLRRLGIPPSRLCSDAVFLRRVYLDTIGILPTPDEARAFLSDQRPDRRSRLIDSLLERDEFADQWALKWGDLLRIKSEYPVRLWPKAVQTYYRWLRQSIRENQPSDRFAHDLLVSSGSNFRSGASNYYRAVTTREPDSFGETTALLFMGVRLSCAHCHGHPLESWTRDDDEGMAAFFSQVRFKGTQEWKEEVTFVDPEASYHHPVTGREVTPKFLDGDPSPMDSRDARERFAQWLTAPQNPWFARNMANRIWYWLLGRGLVEEPDDMRPTNPPSDPELLDYLAHELVSHRYDARHLFRIILNSRTYQLSSTPTPWNRNDLTECSHYRVRRLAAEQLLDAVDGVTGSSESFWTWIPEPYTHLPHDVRAGQLMDGSVDVGFLSLFGRPGRDAPFESDRCSRTSMRQAMQMLNSAEIENKVASGSAVNGLIKSGKTDLQVVDELYLTALSRPPTGHEKQTALDYLHQDAKKPRAEALQDLMWTVLNTKEFLFVR